MGTKRLKQLENYSYPFLATLAESLYHKLRAGNVLIVDPDAVLGMRSTGMRMTPSPVQVLKMEELVKKMEKNDV